LFSSFHTRSHGHTEPGAKGSGGSSLTFRRVGINNPIGLEVMGSRLLDFTVRSLMEPEIIDLLTGCWRAIEGSSLAEQEVDALRRVI
jgi:hypothetical protein